MKEKLIRNKIQIIFMNPATMEKIPAIVFILLGIFALLHLMIFVFNMLSLVLVFIIVAIILFIMSLITGILMLKNSGE